MASGPRFSEARGTGSASLKVYNLRGSAALKLFIFPEQSTAPFRKLCCADRMTTSSSPSPKPVPPPDDRFAAELRRFGPLGVFAILLILFTGNISLGPIVLPVGGVLVVVWVRLSRTPWREIGYVRPRNWITSVAFGLVFGIALKFLMKAIVMPLLGADPINWAYHSWAGNRALLPAAIWTCLAAGWGEETAYRGYMFERLGKLFPPGVGFQSSYRADHVPMVCAGPLLQSGTQRRRTSHHHWAGLRLCFCAQRQALHADVRTRGLRSHRAGDDLLEPGNTGSAHRF